MGKKDNIAKHLDDIDFRSQVERGKQWHADFLSWHAELKARIERHGYTDVLRGQITMLNSVLWYLLPPNEYKALTRGQKFIDVDNLQPEQKQLYLTLNGFGEAHKPFKDTEQVVFEFGKWLGQKRKTNVALTVGKYPQLVADTAYNIIARQKNGIN